MILLKKYVFSLKVIFLCLLISNVINGQEKFEVKVNSLIPDILFKNVFYSSEKVLDIKRQRGKYVVLDFFTKNCTACFQSLPKTNSFQEKYKNKIQFLMIGPDDQGATKTVYDQFHLKLKLNLPVAFVDIGLFYKFNIQYVPHLVWIDSGGIVKGITTSKELTEENISLFLNGGTIIADSSFLVKDTFNFNGLDPFLIHRNGGNDTNFLFRSVLTAWKPGMFHGNTSGVFDKIWKGYYNSERPYENAPAMFQTLGQPISDLYSYAFWGCDQAMIRYKNQYYGKVWPKPVFEILDRNDLDYDYKTGKNLYCYSIITKKPRNDTARQLQEIMQNDLENYFGYVAKIENREWPCLKLLATNASNKLNSKGGPSKIIKRNKTGIHLQNLPISSVIESLAKMPAFEEEIIIDGTGISGNIDFKIEALYTNFEEIKVELAKLGFELVRSTKIMKTLVIKDKSKE